MILLFTILVGISAQLPNNCTPPFSGDISVCTSKPPLAKANVFLPLHVVLVKTDLLSLFSRA